MSNPHHFQILNRQIDKIIDDDTFNTMVFFILGCMIYAVPQKLQHKTLRNSYYNIEIIKYKSDIV